MPTVSIVIVTFNSQRVLGQTLDALEAGSAEMEVLCVDNRSSDDTVAMIQSRPGISLIQNEVNRGFSAGCNQGIDETSGEMILFLNPDAVLQPEALQAMVEALDQAGPKIAGVGPKLVRPEQDSKGRPILDSTGIVLSRSNLSPYDRGQGEPDRGQYDDGAGYLGPSGACALLRRSALEAVAIDGEVFDEDFFAYYEDVDLVWRARLLGFEFLFVPQALVIHDRSNPVAHGGAIEGRAFANRYFCALKNDHRLLRYLPGTALRESARIGFKTVSRWGFASTWPHLVANLGAMLRKRKLLKKRIAIDPENLEAFE
jgi:GT2 family glycosyltransferase